MPDFTFTRGRLTYQQKDGDDETTTHSVATRESLDGTTFDVERPLMQNYRNAVNDLVEGNRTAYSYQAEVQKTRFENRAPATAQREIKLLVHYTDAVTNKPYVTEIGCAKLSVITFIDNTTVVDPTTTEMAAYVTAFNNLVVVEETGNAAVFDYAEIVGRNT